MNGKIIAVGILSILLLTGCAGNGESSFNDNSESGIQTTEPTKVPDSIPVVEETVETEPVAPGDHLPPNPCLLYNGEIYSELIGSDVTEVDGKLYEMLENEIIEPFIDAEKMKAECEYIGQSTLLPVDVLPEHELEHASYYEIPCELYKIDENQILVYCAEEHDVPDRLKGTMFYPGTYRYYAIYTRDMSTKFSTELFVKYYRYKERFPDTYRNWVKMYGLETEE